MTPAGQLPTRWGVAAATVPPLSRRRFGTARQGTTRSTAPAQKTLVFSFITKYFLLILDKVAIVRKGKARRRGDLIGIP